MSTNASPIDVTPSDIWEDSVKTRQKWFFLPLIAFSLCYYTSTMAQYSVLPQYIFKRLLEENDLPASYSNASYCDINRSDPMYQKRKEVQGQSSMIITQAMLIEGLPSIVMVLIYGAYSDEMGRKITIIVPYVGGLFLALCVCLMVNLNLPFYLYYIGSFVFGLTGSYGTFMSGVFAFLADSTTPGQRSLGMGAMEACLGISMVIAHLSVGYWLKSAGANPPTIAITSILAGSSVFLFCVKETFAKPRQSIHGQDAPVPVRMLESVKRQLGKIRNVFALDKQRGRCLALCIAGFSLHVLCYVGSSSVITLYVLNKPFCWTSEWIGIFSATKSAYWQLGMIITLLLLRNKVSDWTLIYMGFVSYTLYNTLFALASLFESPVDNILLISAAGGGVFSSLCGTMIRTICSKLVVQEEQGVVFAAIAGSETIAIVIGFGILNPIYAVTIWFYSGFVFAFMVFLVLIAIGIVVAAHRISNQRNKSNFAILQETTSLPY